MQLKHIVLATTLIAASATAHAAPEQPVWRTQMHADTSTAIAQQGNLALQLIGKAAAERLRESIPALIHITKPAEAAGQTPDSPTGK